MLVFDQKSGCTMSSGADLRALYCSGKFSQSFIDLGTIGYNLIDVDNK